MVFVGKGNSRKAFRIECENPICTQISIVEVDGKFVKSRKGNVCVENVSLGGLKFLSALNMPINNTVIIEFKFSVEKKLITLYGYIVRKEVFRKGVFQYGAHFSSEYVENDESLAKLKKIKTEVLQNSTHFCNRNVAECLMKSDYRINRRKYKRYKYNGKFDAKMNVIKVDNKSIQSEWRKIQVNDISKGGMQIMSSLKLPLINELMLNFKILVSDKEIPLKGIVVRREKTNNMYIYGISFKISEIEMEELEKYFKSDVDFSNNTGTPKRKCLKVKSYKPHQVNDESNEWWV